MVINSLALIEILAFPLAILRFTLQRANWVKIPAKIAGIPYNVCNKPVTNPHNIPTKKAIRIARKKFTPLVISTAATIPPLAKLPSTVKSGISSIL